MPEKRIKMHAPRTDHCKTAGYWGETEHATCSQRQREGGGRKEQGRKGLESQARECGSHQKLEKARNGFSLQTSAEVSLDFSPVILTSDLGPPELGENKPPLC